MESKNVAPLEQIASLKVAVLLIQQPDIGNLLDRDISIPYQSKFFDTTRHGLWKMIDVKIKEKLVILPTALYSRIAKMVQPMHFQSVMWLKDHDLLPHRKGFSLDYRKLLCWNPDGSIRRNETAKKYINDNTIDERDRFIMACNYYYKDDILHFWDIVKIVGIHTTARRGVNSAVRLWMDCLRNGCSQPPNDMIEPYFAIENLKPTDIPLRLSTYFPYLSLELRQQYFQVLGFHHLHEDDFRLCLAQMEETELDELFDRDPVDTLCHFLEWPFESRFIEMTKKVRRLEMNDYMIVLDVILKLFMLCGDVYLDVVKEYWRSIPINIRHQISKSRPYEIYGPVLKCEQNESRDLQEMIGFNFFAHLA